MRQYYISKNTGRKVYPDECARIINLQQAIFYLKKGITIQDFYHSKDYKDTKKDVLVFLVDKKESQEAYMEWQDERSKKK